MSSLQFRNLPVFVAVLSVLLSTALHADVQSGQQAFDAGDYATALSEWRSEAAQGNARALFSLGRMYEQGNGVRIDPYTAFVLYRVAFQRGYKQGEAAANRTGGGLTGGDLSRGVIESERLVREGRYLPNLPGAPMASRQPAPKLPVAEPAPAPAPAKVAAAPEPVPLPVTQTVSPPPQPVAAAAAAPLPVTPTGGRLFDLKYTCALQLRWQDKGSGGHGNLGLFEPIPEPGYFTLGGYAQGNYDMPYGCMVSLKPLGPQAAQMLVPPQRYERVWKDKGTGATMDGSIWRAIPPSDEYVCLGHVGQTGKETPAPAQYRCVHRCLTVATRPTNPIWTTVDTGAKNPLLVFYLSHIGSFIAVPEGQVPAQLDDLNPNAECR